MRKSRSVVAALALLVLMSAGLRAGTVPRPAPDFKINLTNGQQVSISQFKGHTVALIFILTYCPHCQKITSYLIEDQKQYSPRGFQVLASAIEDGAAGAVPGFLKKFTPPFPVGYNARTPVLDFLQHPMAARLIMPALVFIDRDGMIRAEYTGDTPFLNDEAQAGKNIQGEIEQLLTERAPQKKQPPSPKKK